MAYNRSSSVALRICCINLLAASFHSIGVGASIHGTHTKSNPIGLRHEQRDDSLSWMQDVGHRAEHTNVIYVDHPMERRRRRRSLQEDVTVDDDAQDRTILEYDNNDTVDYQPIRIAFVTDLLERRRSESPEFSARIDQILGTLPEAAAIWAQHLSVVPVQDKITVFPTVCHGALGKIPARNVKADLVVIVSGQDSLLTPTGAAQTVCRGQTLAVGSPCQLDQWDRPVIGFINFCLDHQDTDINQFLQESYSTHLNVNLDQTVVNPMEVAIHELAHVLGFTSWLFKYFREPDGTPRTARPFQAQTVKCVNGNDQTFESFPSSQTLELTQTANSITYSINTPRVQQVARNHLDCQTVNGARLENQLNGNTCVGSHWHERLFFGEIMSPSLSSTGGENQLSPLTLALMDDSGWYQVDYRNSQMAVFGLGAGCDFVEQDCIVNDTVPAWGEGMFCQAPVRFNGNGKLTTESLNDAIMCDPSHRTWTMCDLWDESTIPKQLEVFPPARNAGSDTTAVRYFSDTNLVPSFTLAESCPIPSKAVGLDCTVSDPNYDFFYRDETVGPSSRCVNAFHNNGSTRIHRPACLSFTCDLVSRKVLVGSGASQQECERSGQVLFMSSTSTAFLECPRLEAVCPELFACPASCSGRGVCEYKNGAMPVCRCMEGVGDGCYDSSRNVPGDFTMFSASAATTTANYFSLWQVLSLWAGAGLLIHLSTS